MGGQGFVESALQASHREGPAACKGGDEVYYCAKPKHSVVVAGLVDGRVDERPVTNGRPNTNGGKA